MKPQLLLLMRWNGEQKWTAKLGNYQSLLLLHSFFFFKNFKRNKVGQLLITPFYALALYEWNLYEEHFSLGNAAKLRFVKYFLGLFHSLSSFVFSVSLLLKQCIMLPEASGFSAGFLDLRYATFELVLCQNQRNYSTIWKQPSSFGHSPQSRNVPGNFTCN